MPIDYCTSYGVGHTVHAIQALKVGNTAPAERTGRPGTWVSAEGDLLVLELDDGEHVELLNHDVPRVVRAAGGLPLRVSWTGQWGYLAVLEPGVGLSVLPVEQGPLAPCPLTTVGPTGWIPLHEPQTWCREDEGRLVCLSECGCGWRSADYPDELDADLAGLEHDDGAGYDA